MWSLIWMEGIEVGPGKDFSRSFNVWTVREVRMWLRMRSCFVAGERGFGACCGGKGVFWVKKLVNKRIGGRKGF